MAAGTENDYKFLCTSFGGAFVPNYFKHNRYHTCCLVGGNEEVAENWKNQVYLTNKLIDSIIPNSR